MMGSAGGARHGAEVMQGLARVRLVDHGGQQHQAIGADLLGVARVAGSQRRGGFGDARQHRHPAAHHLGDRPQHGVFFFGR